MAVEMTFKKKLGSFTLDMHLKSSNRRIGILGASGCGKSMTLKSIAGIVTPDEGRIIVDQKVVFDSEKKVNWKPQKRNVGYLFQNYALFPNMTVKANIAAGLKGTKAEQDKRVEVHQMCLPSPVWASGCRGSCPAASSREPLWQESWHTSRI